MADLPLLQQDLYGQSGRPGGWMYGSQRSWAQLANASSPAAQFAADCAALLALARAHSDVLARDTCGPRAIAPLAVLAAAPAAPALAPYVRYSTAALRAVLVAGNAQPGAPLALTLRVPLQAMGWAGRGLAFVAQYLYGGDGSRGQFAVAEAALGALNVSVPGDLAAGGGATVLLLTAS